MRFIFRERSRYPKIFPKKREKTIGWIFLLSLSFFLLSQFLPFPDTQQIQTKMEEASSVMAESTKIICRCRMNKDIAIDPSVDVNKTGLIGVNYSPMTTSIGNLEAKRTTTNPNLAALVVFLFKKAGVGQGDTVAVGASGSFPALIVAVLSAAKVLDLNVLMICSLGASQWGADLPDFHWLDMYDCLEKNEILSARLVALSLGGEQDIGEGMPEGTRNHLIKDIQRKKVPFLQEPDLFRNVRKRMELFRSAAGGRPIKAYANIGGGWARMGEDTEILRLKPGIVRVERVPAAGKRGMIFEMASAGIPVIHLLYIKGLIENHGLPWDPVPLPEPGKGRLYILVRQSQLSFLLLGGLYLLMIGIIVARFWLLKP